MEIFGMTVHNVTETADALPKMKHVSGHGPKARYSYGGVRDLICKRFPNKVPFRQGAFMPVEQLAQAQAILENRPRVRVRYVGQDVQTTDLFGKALVSLEALAAYTGYSLSNVRKVFYDEESGLAALFTTLHGGFLLSEAEFQDFIAWAPQFGAGPRPTRRKRPIGHRTALLNTSKVNAARRVDTKPTEKEQDL